MYINMLMRKIFVGIELPQRVKNLLDRKIEKWRGYPVKWSKKENLHITLVFLGYIEDEKMVEVCEAVREACGSIEMFDIFFEKIELAPTQEDPRMIWASGRLSEELRHVHMKIEKALNLFVSEKKAFRPHITLGKLRKKKWEEAGDLRIEEEIGVPVEVDSVTVFESVNEEGRQFMRVEQCPFE